MKKNVFVLPFLLILSACITTNNTIAKKSNINIVSLAGPQHTTFVEELNSTVKNLAFSAHTFAMYESTIDNLNASLMDNDDSDRNNIILLVGHGMSGEVALAETLDFTRLISICESTPQPDIVFIDSCFSGSIINFIDESDGDIVIITSTDKNIATSANEDVGLSKSIAIIFDNPEIADLNNDSLVSASEVYKKAKDITYDYLQSPEWLDQAEYWNQHPNNEYGIYGNKELILFAL